jgi:hypothetical protein
MTYNSLEAFNFSLPTANVFTGAVAVLKDPVGPQDISNWSDLLIFYPRTGGAGSTAGCEAAVKPGAVQGPGANSVLVISDKSDPPSVLTVQDIAQACPSLVLPAGAQNLGTVIQASPFFATIPEFVAAEDAGVTSTTTYAPVESTFAASYNVIDGAADVVPALPPWGFGVLLAGLFGCGAYLARRPRFGGSPAGA